MLFCALLVYVALDFCLPAMPGAFVFEPDESIDSVRVDRSRADVDALVALPLAEAPVVPPPLETQLTYRLVVRPEAPPVVRPRLGRLPRAALPSAHSTEDPH